MVPEQTYQNSALCRMFSELDAQRLAQETGVKYENIKQLLLLAEQVANKGTEILKPYEEAGIIKRNGNSKLETKL